MAKLAGAPVALTDAEVRRLVEAGIAAPSGGNVQPWRVVVHQDALEIGLDLERSDSFIDVGRWASVMALGSFAENVLVTAVALGLETELELPEAEAVEDTLVRVRFVQRLPEGEGSEQLESAIFARATNRHPGDGKPLDAAEIEALSGAVEAVSPEYTLRALHSEADRSALAELLARADVVRMYHRELHAQMFSEVRWSREEAERTGDGVDVRTLEVPRPAVWVMRSLSYYPLVRSLVPRALVRSMTRGPIIASSHVCCITMPEPPSPQRLFTAGRALERMWLTATHRGLALQPWTVLPFFTFRARYFPSSGFTELEEREILAVDSALRTLFGVPEGCAPVFVFRLSHAPPPSIRALRRPFGDIVESE